jgi:hypothetical protein
MMGCFEAADLRAGQPGTSAARKFSKLNELSFHGSSRKDGVD